MPLALDAENIVLSSGKHPFLLRYDDVGRGYCFLTEQSFRRPPLAKHNATLRWHNATQILPFDAQPAPTTPLGWYRFTSAPGLRSLAFRAYGKARLWVAGQECTLEAEPSDGDAIVYRATLPMQFGTWPT
ncbi:MAG: hypothetical protein IPK17_00130 [Chloroflexi bacterium]|uniref:hypothetical protein n=1 Tax=Candidatus Flexifilum breve TaxID=3140694 RepID=UPI003137391C|nr:hypothetical protein [Chloroflexota bacterium]